jgi:hypothetical protein
MTTDQLLRELCRTYNASFDVGITGGQFFYRMIGTITVTGTGATTADALADVVNQIAKREAKAA